MQLCVAHKKQDKKINGTDTVLYTGVNPDAFLQALLACTYPMADKIRNELRLKTLKLF